MKSLPLFFTFALILNVYPSLNGTKISTITALKTPEQDLPTPAGTTKIDNNLYLDIAEVTNRMYLEFMAWTADIYGKNSEEYKNSLPDKTLWRSIDSKYKPLDKYYLRHPKFQSYPVIGLTYKQVKKFCQWRSDRVMEYFLVKNGVFEEDQNPTPSSVFTIEKYFKGNYKNIDPDPEFMQYPHYSLPDKETYKLAYSIADSPYIHPPKAQPVSYRANLLLHVLNSSKKGSKSSGKISNDVHRKGELIDLKTNVRELTNSKGTVYGNSYIDDDNSSKAVFRETKDTLNPYTGFRNRCTYKEWRN